MNPPWVWQAAATVLLILLTVAALPVLRRRRTARRRHHLADLRATGQLPPDIEGALRRAAQHTRRD